jgi:hypothetical protein
MREEERKGGNGEEKNNRVSKWTSFKTDMPKWQLCCRIILRRELRTLPHFISYHRSVKTIKIARELNGSVDTKRRTSWWVYLASCVSHMLCSDDVLNTGWQVAVRTSLTASH